MFKVVLVTLVAAASAAPQSYRAPAGRVQGGRGAAAGVGGAFNQAGSGFSQAASGPAFSQGGGFNQQYQSGPVVAILRDDRNGPIDGNYDFAFETADGISRQEAGSPSGPNGAVVQQGGWSFTFPDGTQGQFTFVADENGYRVESPLLPVGPAIPPHALEQIRKAEQERAQGIIHDGQYRGEGSQQSFSQVQGGGGGFNRQRGSYN